MTRITWKALNTPTKLWILEWANVLVMFKLIVFMLMMAGGTYMYCEYEHHSGMWWAGAMTLYFGMACATLYIIVWIFLIIGNFLVNKYGE